MSSNPALLSKIEKQDRRYRLALMVFMVSTAITIGILAGFQIKTNSKVDRQLQLQGKLLTQQADVLAAIKANGDQNSEQLQKVSDHIDCIAAFFNSRDRTSAVITDLNQCSIERLDGSTATLPKTNTFAQPDADSGTQSGGQSPQNSQQNQANPTPSQPVEPPPAEVLGIPVCVPFTNACIR